MKKIISLFKRDYDGSRQVYDEVTEGAEWVVAGEGRATVKYDGTCVMVRDDEMFKRYEVKKGKTAPADFEAAGPVDPETGKQVGWRPVGDGPEDKWHREALMNGRRPCSDGTFELCGPKIQGNPEGVPEHRLLRHGLMFTVPVPRTFDELKAWFVGMNIEGIVWHHPDGRMVKIKQKDFGLKRPTRERTAT